MGPDGIDVRPRIREAVCGDLERLLNLYELSGLYSTTLDPLLREQVKLAIARLPGVVSAESSRMFLGILSRTGNVGAILRSMYNTGVLERLIPEMSHARCLLQFNQYHSYTVDEHSLRAVEAVEKFEQDSGPVGAAYREIRQKQILHLALLLHDLGKGFEEDHSEVGRRLRKPWRGGWA